MASTSKTSHEVGDLRLCVEAYLDFTELHPWQQLAAVRAQHSLNVMAIQGQLDLRASKRIFEYGAGTGGATYALGRLATLNGGSVEAAELEPEHAAEIAISGILPPENIHIGDGAWTLRQLNRKGKRFDLVAAFMFGPDYFGSRIGRLLHEVGPALDENGKFLVTSDPQTMEAARTVCFDNDIEFHSYFPPLTRHFDPDRPDKMDTIVIPRANLPK